MKMLSGSTAWERPEESRRHVMKEPIPLEPQVSREHRSVDTSTKGTSLSIIGAMGKVVVLRVLRVRKI